MLALIEYDKKRSPVVVKTPMETTHKGGLSGGGKIADGSHTVQRKMYGARKVQRLAYHFAFD